MGFKRNLSLYVKNFFGWKTNRKIVTFSIDDFGNIVLNSKQARNALEKAGLPVNQTRFSRLDVLENSDDLLGLYEVLSSVRDPDGRNPCFTAFTMSANINFEAIEKNNFTKYEYETLPETFAKLPGYEAAWKHWQEGIDKNLIVPEFHGREHLNVNFLENGLKEKNAFVMTNLKNKSWAALGYDGKIGFTEAYSFNKFTEVDQHREIILDGLKLFKTIFGRNALHFNAPGAREHSSLHPFLFSNGIKMIDSDLIKKEHQGDGIYKTLYFPFGEKTKSGLISVFRNCIFEPSLTENKDWVGSCLKEIDIAFKMGKPANITSHRINFVGGIEQRNRDEGLLQLKILLASIVKKWPDVQFDVMRNII
jgi:hypothetical protein